MSQVVNFSTKPGLALFDIWPSDGDNKYHMTSSNSYYTVISWVVMAHNGHDAVMSLVWTSLLYATRHPVRERCSSMQVRGGSWTTEHDAFAGLYIMLSVYITSHDRREQYICGFEMPSLQNGKTRMLVRGVLLNE